MKSVLEQQADALLAKEGYDPDGRPKGEVPPEQQAFEAAMVESRGLTPGEPDDEEGE